MSDPADDPLTRVELIRKLDLLPPALGYRAFDPEIRTIGGRALTDDEAHILLSCTVDDIYAAADALNAEAEIMNERAVLTNQINELTRPFDQGDGWEGAVGRMPIDQRRDVRKLMNHLSRISPPRPGPGTPDSP